MSAVVQMPTPQAELVENRKPRLAFTRKDGWIVVRPGPKTELPEYSSAYFARPGGKRVMQYDILAWADLPPVPENAA